MADEAPAEGPPEGRSDPGSGLGSKIGPLPLWGWLAAGAAVFAYVWWSSQQQSTPATQTVGNAASTLGATGVTITDPLTADALLTAMQNQATNMAELNSSISNLMHGNGTTVVSNPGTVIGNTTPGGVRWPSFSQWLSSPGRTDITSALQAGKLSALQGEYAKETAVVNVENGILHGTSRQFGGTATALLSGA